MKKEADYMKDFQPTRGERLDIQKRKKAIFIGIFVGIVVAGAVSMMTFGRYVSLYRHIDGELPLIKADNSPFRMRPDTPGGMEVPNQDKLVYERLRRDGDTMLPVEKLLPAPEKPSLPEKIDTKKAEKSEDPIGALAKQIVPEEIEAENGNESHEIASTTIVDEKGETVEVMFRTVPAEQAEKDIKKTPEKSIRPEEKKIPETPKTEKNVIAEPKTSVKKEEKQVFMLQLVSTRKKESSESEWKRLSKKHADILSALPHTVSEIVSEKGTFYRLRAGSFETKQSAEEICKKLKSKKQECIIVKQ